MPEIKFGWVTPALGIAATNYTPLAITQQADILPVVARYFDSIWIYDHFYGFDNPDDPYLESWTTLTWLAARFRGLHVGPIVMGVGYRSPALLAKMAATLQTLSEGRLILGLGAGWRDEEHRAYGYPFPEASARVRQLEEAVQVIHSMWTETAPSFKGEYYEINQAYCPPRPNPRPPILIGGSGEQLMLPLVGRRADWWNVGSLSPAEFQRKWDIVRREAEAAGRDPERIVRTMIKMDYELPHASADSARLLKELRPIVKLGLTYFMFDCGHVTSTSAIVRFAQEVMEPLREEGQSR